MGKIPFFPAEQDQKDNKDKLHDILLCEDELYTNEIDFISSIMEVIEAEIPLTSAQQDWFDIIYERVT